LKLCFAYILGQRERQIKKKKKNQNQNRKSKKKTLNPFLLFYISLYFPLCFFFFYYFLLARKKRGDEKESVNFEWSRHGQS
jgi:ATP-dependent Zn protease